jgi:phage terminase small subunit
MSRGPKVKTACNSRRGTTGIVRHATLEPPCELTPEAAKEYSRLIGVLRAKGTLDRMDLSCVAECARVAALLNAAYAGIEGKPTWEEAKLIGLLSGQHRGRLRELGLTTMPSRTMSRANPAGSARDEQSKWTGTLKVGQT